MSTSNNSNDTPDRRPRQYGKYWLEKRENSPYWYRVHYDPKKKQHVRISLRTRIHDEAVKKLVYLKSIELDPDRKLPEQVQIHSILNWYWENHGRSVRSAKMQALAIKFWKNHFPEETTVADLIPVRTAQFIEALRNLGHSSGYISRTLSVGRAALKMAHNNQLVHYIPKIPSGQSSEEKESVEPMGRPLEVKELALLLDAQPAMHMQAFIYILINTMCRPEAALNLRRSQVDFVSGVVNLNPKGRRQTKKRRPIVPLTASLAKILTAIEQSEVAAAEARGETDFSFDYYITFRGKPLKTVKTSWYKMVEKAGFVTKSENDPKKTIREPITQYSIRHTMGRYLRQQRVPSEEISLMLGHKPKGVGRVTTVYAPYGPDYLREAAKCIDTYMLKLYEELEKLRARK
jgi:integrase